MASGMMTFTGGVGVVVLQGDEYVYAATGSPNVLSHLIWQSAAPTLTTAMDVKLPQGWTFLAQANVAGLGRSYMEDYDWFGPDFVSYDPSEWTHRSQHQNTALDWYFNGQFYVGHDFSVNATSTINVNAGLQYTDVQWAAAGGSFAYSDFNPGDGCGFRGCVGSFPNTPAITFRQQLPAAVVGLDFLTKQGAWTFGGAAHGGITLWAHDTDDHWLRSFTAFDALRMAPVVSLSGEATYQVSERTQLSLSAAVDRVFVGRGNSDTVFHDGTPNFSLTDRVGGGFMSASASVSLKGHF